VDRKASTWVHARRRVARMQLSIRSRLLLLVLSVLLPAVASAAWLIAQTYTAERQANERALRDTTRALSLVVDRELNQRAAIARMLSLSPTLDDGPQIDIAPLLLFDQQARRAISGLAGWVQLSLPGRVLLDTRLPAGTVPPAGPPDPNGEALAEQPVTGPLRSAPAHDVPYAAIVQPVQRNGRTLLNVTVTILPEELQRIIDAQHLPADWVGAVLDGRGTVVARHPGGTAFAGSSATPDLKEQLAMRLDGRFNSVSLDGNRVVGYFSTSSQGWTYVTAMPAAQFSGRLPTAVLQVSLGALALLGVAVCGSLWVSRRIAAPVYSLKRAAARIQAGQPVERVATGIRECDEVARALAEAGETMQRARAELERQVSDAIERTRTAEQRVSQSQRVEALGRLTGGVAHDFNNLLGVISNSAYLIQRHATDRDLQMAVAATLRAVDVGSRLTQHLLRVAGRQPVRPQLIELGRFLPELQELMGMVLGKRVAVLITVAPGTRPVTVDSGELELALINLALNARDAMPNGGRIWLKACNAEAQNLAGLAPGAYVLITVADEGLGIAPELADRVFEPFFTTKATGKGTGLGLSQVHGFCLQAGGVARLASTPGLGTSVTMILPVATSDAHSTAPAAAGAPAQPTRPDSIAGARVLIVEDNEQLGEVTAALLDTYGCKVHHARNPGDALRALQAQADFDVVLSDVVMPGDMDGVRLARLLRSLRPTLPVVLISGFSTALADAGDFVVLHKPCSREDLLAALHQAIHGARPPARQRPAPP